MDIKMLLIDENETILNAMELLDKVAKKVLFILKDEKLAASLTDGDIRRWILSKGELSAPVKMAANYNPKYLEENQKDLAHTFMKQESIEMLPIVNDNHEILSLIMWDEREFLVSREQLAIPVVIMAGGLGTRLYPYTKILPKPLIPIGDIPIAERIINQFCSCGCSDFYFVVNHKKNMVKAYFNEIDKNYNIDYIDEEKSLGTGGGLSLLKGKIKESFILSNCDTLLNTDMAKVYNFHKKNKNVITMICSLKNYIVPYGVVDIGLSGEIENMHEKPKYSFFTNTGCYIVEPEVIDSLEYNEPIGFPSIIEKYRFLGRKVGVYPVSEKAWRDMGEIDELEKMRKEFEE